MTNRGREALTLRRALTGSTLLNLGNYHPSEKKPNG